MSGSEYRATDHYRGTWNANIGEQTHSAEVGYFTQVKDVMKAASSTNPFDSAFADMATSTTQARKVDSNFKDKLALALEGKSKPEKREKEKPTLKAPSQNFLEMQQKLSAAAPSVIVRKEQQDRTISTMQEDEQAAPEIKDAIDIGTSNTAYDPFDNLEDMIPALPLVAGTEMKHDKNVDKENDKKEKAEAKKIEDEVEDLFASLDHDLNPSAKFSSDENFDMFNSSKTNSDENFDMFDSSKTFPSQPDLFNSQKSIASSPDAVDTSTFDPFSNMSKDMEEEAVCEDENEGINFDDEKEILQEESDGGESGSCEEEQFSEDEGSDEEVIENEVEEPETMGIAQPSEFNSTEQFKNFLMSPITSKKLMKCIFRFDFKKNEWVLLNSSNGQMLMTARLRTDGFKVLSTAAHYAISMSDTYNTNSVGNQNFGNTAAKSNLIAKLKSNISKTEFNLFDTGKSGKRATGAMHARRELGAMTMRKRSGETLRRVKVCIPANEQYRRPRSKKDYLFDRHKKGDPTVTLFENHVPGRPYRLPSLQDYQGMALRSSMANVMLHDPADHEGDIAFVLGKTKRATYNLYFKYPFSPLCAFSIALVEISKVG